MHTTSTSAVATSVAPRRMRWLTFSLTPRVSTKRVRTESASSMRAAARNSIPIFVTVTAFNLLGDGLRRSLDVRLAETGR